MSGKFLITLKDSSPAVYYMGSTTMAGGMYNFVGSIDMAMRFDAEDAAKEAIAKLPMAQCLIAVPEPTEVK